jgi:AraC family transcriptional regulator of adaptative response/methylated-DNA-[protein]-cysteine methyltransferase
METKEYHSAWIETPLGPMMAIADEKALHLLEFAERKNLERQIKRFKTIPGRTPPIDSIEKELGQYFDGALKTFRTPHAFQGTPFQRRVWEELQKIPFGETRSYSALASAIDRPKAFRAVAQANRSNRLAIIIPCHRVINASGNLAGYAGGIPRKQWLISHERT